MSVKEEEVKKRFRNIKYIIPFAFIFLVTGSILVIVANYWDKNWTSYDFPIHLYVYSIIAFTIGGILMFVFLFLWIIKRQRQNEI